MSKRIVAVALVLIALVCCGTPTSGFRNPHALGSKSIPDRGQLARKVPLLGTCSTCNAGREDPDFG
jgi:hypothetical protein